MAVGTSRRCLLQMCFAKDDDVDDGDGDEDQVGNRDEIENI
jgi:hypothetical protein